MIMEDEFSAFKALSEDWISLKDQEEDIKNKRLDIEKKLLKYVSSKEEGTQSRQIGGLSMKVKFGINRTINADLLRQEWQNINPLIAKCFLFKPELVMKEVKFLEEIDSDQRRILGKYIIEKQAKPHFEITRVDD
jgi:hypothetical protein